MRGLKLYFVILVAVVVLVASGCMGMGSKKLTCTQNTDGVDIEFNVGFSGNTIKSMDFSYDMDLSAYSDTQIGMIENQDFCSIVKSSMSEYSNAFTDCKQNISDKHLQVSAAFDVDKLTSSVLEKMTTPSAAKKDLEKQGYKCVIK